MKQSEANKLLIQRFKAAIKKAKKAETFEEEINYTDCAHKLYITLSNAGAFENETLQSLANNGTVH